MTARKATAGEDGGGAASHPSRHPNDEGLSLGTAGNAKDEAPSECSGLVRSAVLVERRDHPGVLFMEFVVQFVYLDSGLVQSSLAGGGDPVDPAAVACNVFENRLQQAGAFEAVEQGVEGSGTDAVAVMLKFLHHRQAEDGLVGRMDEHMNPDESKKEFPLLV
jgi:hypothetical protein